MERKTEIEPNQTEREKRNKATGPALASSVSASPLCLIIELFGVARLKAKTDCVTLHLTQGATLTDALAALATRCPVLVGVVISPEDHTLLPGYTCNLNGVEFLRDYHTAIRDGDHLLILSSDAGG